MADENLRELERRARADPEDEAAWSRWRVALVRAGTDAEAARRDRVRRLVQVYLGLEGRRSRIADELLDDGPRAERAEAVDGDLQALRGVVLARLSSILRGPDLSWGPPEADDPRFVRVLDVALNRAGERVRLRRDEREARGRRTARDAAVLVLGCRSCGASPDEPCRGLPRGRWHPSRLVESMATTHAGRAPIPTEEIDWDALRGATTPIAEAARRLGISVAEAGAAFSVVAPALREAWRAAGAHGGTLDEAERVAARPVPREPTICPCRRGRLRLEPRAGHPGTLAVSCDVGLGRPLRLGTLEWSGEDASPPRDEHARHLLEVVQGVVNSFGHDRRGWRVQMSACVARSSREGPRGEADCRHAWTPGESAIARAGGDAGTCELCLRQFYTPLGDRTISP